MVRPTYRRHTFSAIRGGVSSSDIGGHRPRFRKSSTITGALCLAPKIIGDMRQPVVLSVAACAGARCHRGVVEVADSHTLLSAVPPETLAGR